MKYVFELEDDNDCRRCPYAHKEGEWFCFHQQVGRSNKMLDEEYEITTNELRVVRPDWCPLISFDEARARELLESINSQPTKDEPKETIRVELYESETEKLGALSIANGLNGAQMVAKLIGDYRIAKVYVNHGDHGPEPRFPNDAWTMWHCCGNCDHSVSYGDNYCKHCGAKLDWSEQKEGADGRA